MQTILLCKTRQGPTPEQVAEALRREGYSAFVEAESGNLIHSLAAEIRYAPGRMPIVISFYHDLIDYPDVGDSDYWGWMEQLVPDAQARKGLRRFIFVSALENVDKKVLQAVVDYLQVQTNATVTT